MKKRRVRFAAMMCVAAMLIAMLPFNGKIYAADEDKIVRVGLNYGSGSLAVAKLQNFIGSGYTFGSYDSSNRFIPLYSSNSVKVSILRDKNHVPSTGKYYDSAADIPSASMLVGAYHLQYPIGAMTQSDISTEVAFIKTLGYAAFPAYSNGALYINIGSYESIQAADGAREAVAAATGKAVVAIGGLDRCRTVIDSDTAEILFEYDDTSGSLAINPVSTDGTPAQTWFKGYKYYGGFEYRVASNGNTAVVNVLDITSYTKGVIPYEIGPKWHLEAQKAQALCAKNFVLANMGKHSAYGFDVCGTTCCQMYCGTNQATELSNSAVEAVSGLKVTYNGELCNTCYHSSSGGYTEDAANVWGKDVPYLKAVPDVNEKEPNEWTRTITAAQVSDILNGKGHQNSGVAAMYVDKYTASGNVYRLNIITTGGKTYSFEKEQARTVLGAPYTISMRYYIEGGDVPANFVPDGSALIPTPDPPETNPDAPIMTGGGVVVNNGGFLSTVNGSTAITGNGSYITLTDKLEAITSKGLVALDTSGKTNAKTNNAVVVHGQSFTIVGRGWGHNVGMSQMGAKGMAESGYTYDQIIKYYYTGAVIGY